MENYRTSSHCTYDIKYHIVWITKYRKTILTGKIAERTRDIIRQVCSSNDVEIISGHVGKDHIHLLASVPPHLSASRLVQYIKGSSSYKMQKEFKELNQQYWGRHMWARGYFVASSGNVTDEVIAEYIKNQDIEERKNSDNFRIIAIQINRRTKGDDAGECRARRRTKAYWRMSRTTTQLCAYRGVELVWIFVWFAIG